ncbi:Asp-tRNA(Asn)/Glu-tRNA(Gln) amidotransferase subunit GatB [Sulfitobacter mediterraneus]|uniref:Asp-tRNA(Asn)/Glu-tRNA(Gln) amidotransferase subunit GatB n=1 Tax=Sulfitobacter mediterraneus TaxID=83219 RepID=UPI00193A369D|nr:Asp-tRNA(Asn)/Glu-tRNA(Gln) amidotransferase subunit GatB [Sulfitobacter mediterraneus]MBM1557346.1 Asp-tRNA(Asn)/Glu-tRNA(Gln) amidotransferase subunit GatB [Sulfitobacter mediterraneus]MBM1568392.1 Asp-tRNA(Asn)/Glu-tRNA(Gln) amidotransferase subunit GatB [Sulfitobacter mediterraneus]MBM1572005.1 Asp-tRNA(Asn)/Glu-tRNA(Gln) amidotransferase subunit GatB [Sulfitobacter mediterraneus]MBM1575794.1 Asp-tRNA(Asn)/Glu-tRNA(Gln) amidotransferase subunit GatB [Sulfitobacter mediterraneus]MBM15801
MLDLTYDTPKPRVIAGAKNDWELVIGMEVHAQVQSNAKLFSGASTKFGAEPNSNVAFVDAAMPGMLPVINEYCVEQAVRTGLGLKAQINLKSAFDRKNYFYPDLPQGYQISQLYEPIVGEGEVLVEMGDGTARLVRVERIHMEQDAGKSIHDMDPNMSFVDLNRTGVCLMEIVSRPDIRGPEEAAAYLGKLRQILRYLGTCNGDMQSGAMRADVNVSICRPGQYEKYQETQDFSHLGTRCEIKNMNSMRFIQQAIEVEARRQIAIVEAGGEVVQETRLFDPDKQETRSMRSKEEAHDYRYFPDPDLLPLEIEQAWVDDIAANLPELPDAKKARFIGGLGLSDYNASVLTAELQAANYFEEVLAVLSTQGVEPETKQSNHTVAHGVSNMVVNELFGALKKDDVAIENSPIAPAHLASIVVLMRDGVISSKIAKDVFEITYTTGREPGEIVETEGMKQVTDTGAIEAAVDEIIAANPDQVAKAKENPKLAGWFVGQVMKATGGKANPKAVNQLVAKKLNS